ncbi:unnamed protein product [Peniophora sp. CBMAI 1063]|nr:unnamed protein product [Peniophora sp. CBMAI 1063]
MPPHGKGLPPRKTVRCKFFNDDGEPISGGCNRSAAACLFVHPDEPQWTDAEKRLNPGVEMASRGRRYSNNSSNYRSGRPLSRSRSRSPLSRSPSPAHRSRLPGPSSRRRRSPTPPRRPGDRSRSPQGDYYDGRFARRVERDRGYGRQSPTRSARASSPSHSSARATSPPTPRQRPPQAQAGPSRAPMSPVQVQPARSDTMAVDPAPATPTAPATLRPGPPPQRASGSLGGMGPPPPPPPPSSMPPPPPPSLPPFAPNPFKVPLPPPQMVGDRLMTEKEKVDIWDKRIALAADALVLRREANKLLEDLQQAEALSSTSPAVAEAAQRLGERKKQVDEELRKKIELLNREHFWPITKEVDVEKLQKEFEGMGEKAVEVQEKLAEFETLLREVMRKDAQLRGEGEGDGHGGGRARKRRRIEDSEDGEVGSDDEEVAREKELIVEAEKHLEVLYTGIRAQMDDLKESVAQEARDAKEEVLAKIDDSVADILASFQAEEGEEGGLVFRAEPGPLAMARLEREESRQQGFENDLRVLREEHEELIRMKDEKIAEQEAEIAQLRALLEEVTIGYERDKAETEALVAASETHAAALEQRLANPPQRAPIPDAMTILDSLPTSLDEMVMAKLHPLMVEANESTRKKLEAHSKSVQEKIVSTVIEGARVAHVLVNYLNAKDREGLQAVLESMTAQEGKNGARAIQPSSSAAKPGSMLPPPRPVSSISVPQKMPPTGASQLPQGMTNGWPESVGHQVPAPGPQHAYSQWTSIQQNQGVGTPGQTPLPHVQGISKAYSQADFVQGHASLMELMQAARRDTATTPSSSDAATSFASPSVNAEGTRSRSRPLDVPMDIDSSSAPLATSQPANGIHTPHLDSSTSTSAAPPLSTSPLANTSSTVKPTANTHPPTGALPTSTRSEPITPSTTHTTASRTLAAPTPLVPPPVAIASQRSRSRSVSPPPSPPSGIQPSSVSSANAPAPVPKRSSPSLTVTPAPASSSGPSVQRKQSGAAPNPTFALGKTHATKTAEPKHPPATTAVPRAASQAIAQPASAPARAHSFPTGSQPARRTPPDTAGSAVAAAYGARRTSMSGRESDQSRKEQEPPASAPPGSSLRREAWPPPGERARRPSGPETHAVPEVLPPLRLGNNGFVPDERRASATSPSVGTMPRTAGLPPAPRLVSSTSREGTAPQAERGRENQAAPSRYRRRDAYSASPNWD